MDFDGLAALIAGVAFLALWRFEPGVVPVILAAAIAGLLHVVGQS